MTSNDNDKRPRWYQRGLFSDLYQCDAWLRELDLNQRPSGYEPDELPDCSIPRHLAQASLEGSRDAKRANR